jgi:tetratricopeptide (TPR) repeat protein
MMSWLLEKRSMLVALAAISLLLLEGAAAQAGSPKQIEAWRAEARQASAAGQLDKAIELLSRAAAESDDLEIQKELGQVQSWAGKIDEAAATLRRCLTRQPGNREVQLALANALSWSKKPEHLRESIKLFDDYLAARPADDQARLQRGRVHGWAGQIDLGAADLRAYLARHPADEKVQAELATMLSWSKDKNRLAESLQLFDAYLAKHADDDELRLRRARARGWVGHLDLAAADFRYYLARHPADDKVRLEMATVLSWSKDSKQLAEALALFDGYLAKHPGDLEVTLQRARSRSWTGAAKLSGAVADYRQYLAHRSDPKVRLELARALAWAGRLDEARKEFDAVGDDDEARLGRALVLRWGGKHVEAEREIERLRGSVKDSALRRTVDVELSRLWAETDRRLGALTLLDRVIADDPGNREAQDERERQLRYFRPTATPGFFLYADKSKINVIATTLSGKVPVHRTVSLFVDLALWRLAAAKPGTGDGWSLLAERVDLGVQTRITDYLQAEVAAGPRTYERFSTNFGMHAALSSRPWSFLGLAFRYEYDDVYYNMYQPVSVPAQVRGSFLYGDAEAKLPRGILVAGRAGGHLLGPDNSSAELTGTATVPLNIAGGPAWLGLLRAGYFGQWMAWHRNDAAYWSPQGYAAHMFLLRAAQGLNAIGLYYDLQLSVGTAAERAQREGEAGIDSGYMFAMGAAGGLAWTPTPRLTLRASLQYGQTVRETPVAAAVSSTQPGSAGTTTISTYWWLAGMAMLNVVF